MSLLQWRMREEFAVAVAAAIAGVPALPKIPRSGGVTTVTAPSLPLLVTEALELVGSTFPIRCRGQ